MSWLIRSKRPSLSNIRSLCSRVSITKENTVTADVKRVYAFGKDAEGNNVTEGNKDMKYNPLAARARTSPRWP